MAKPRIFVSSTYYDLRPIRALLEQFIRQYGFDPILNERGNIPYGSEDKPEQYAYKEIENCDILVAIVGSKFGTESTEGKYSVSQRELKTAHEHDKQIYIFVENNVFTEYRTYLANKGLAGFSPAYGDVRVYEFLEEIEKYSKNNSISSFDTALEIIDFLREQWAGLFHRFLGERRIAQENRSISELKAVTKSLESILQALSEQVTSQAEPIQEILFSIHPAFEAIRSAVGINHRVYFTEKSELTSLLRAYGYEEQYDPFIEEGEDHVIEYQRDSKTAISIVNVVSTIFDAEEKLRIISPNNWKDTYIESEKKIKKVQPDDEYDPFANE
jgi:hypothetical protein